MKKICYFLLEIKVTDLLLPLKSFTCPIFWSMNNDVFWSQCGTKDEHDFCEKLIEWHVQNVLNSLARIGCIKSGHSPNLMHSFKLHTYAKTLCRGWTLPHETLLYDY